MKNILIITYYWPPSGGSGVQRWMYFSKYLSEFGHIPTVLTVSEKKASYGSLDESLVSHVKHIKTYKTKTFELLKLYSLITKGSTTKGIPQGHVGTDKKSIFNKVSNYIRSNYFIPDARVGWNKYALNEARKIIKTDKIDLIITTGPPHSSHLIGMQLKKEFSIKWIADLRDPWNELYYNKDLLRTKKATNKDKEFEREVLENADKILTVGFKLKELLQAKTDKNHNKFHHIYNGYDSELMNAAPVETHDHFEITFTGLLSKKQPYETMIKAIKVFLSKTPGANIKICFAGNIDKNILKEFIKEFTTSKIIHKGYLPHIKALGLMKQSQLLVNILADMEENQILISGKLMEYIATGNPILCIGNTEGESALMVKDIENAKVFEKHQINNSAEFMLKTYKEWDSGISRKNNTNSKLITEKSRYETTRQLSELINSI